MNRLPALLIASLLACLPLTGLAESLDERVQRILATTPLIDGHNDLPWAYHLRVGGHLDQMPMHDDLTALPNPTHTDLPRLRAGGMGGQFWSVYVPISEYPGAPGDASRVMTQMDLVYRLIERYPNDLELALTAADIERIHQSGRIASLMGIEGGHAIENSLGTLRSFYRAGARYMTLTHSRGLRWADSATDTARVDGLSPFGEEVVREMNRIGMLVDLSHVSPATMHDALAVSRAPVIFSHSSAHTVTGHERNVPDDVLLKVRENGGVVMVTFFASYVSEAVKTAWRDKLDQLELQIPDRSERMKAFSEWRQDSDIRATLAQVADHIDHIRNLIGASHIGLGGDYDGMPPGPVGLEDVSTYPALLKELLRRGYSDEEVAGIAGGNVLRVMKQAEAVAARLQQEKPASDALIDELDAGLPVPAD